MNNNQDLAREMEENLIGSLLKNPSRLDAVKEIIIPDDIWLIRARDAYNAMLSLQAQGMEIDTVTLGDELERHGKLSEWNGGRVALQRIRENFRGDEPISYAAKILDYSAKRKMLEEFSTGASWTNNGRDAAAIRADMIARLTNIKTPNAHADRHSMTMKDAISRVYDNVDEAARLTADGKIRDDIIPTGFIDLDKMYDNGIPAPDLTIIAARPGQGKTSLLLCIALNACQKHKKRGLVISLEMSNEQVTTRMMSIDTGIPYGAMMTGKMQESEWPIFTNAIERFEDLKIHLNDMPSITVNQIRQEFRKVEALHGKPDFVVVDYLQLQGVDGKHENRTQQVGSISRGLKGMAKEFNVPVFAAAQLSRALEQRSDKRPQLSDLRESGDIEADADNVWFIYRPDQYEKDTTKQNTAELIVAKHRNGATGTVELIFRPSMTKFESAMSRIFRP